MTIVFLHYNYIAEYDSPAAWIQRIRPYTGIMEAIGKKCRVIYIGQINYEGDYEQNGVIYRFLKPKGSGRFPARLHKAVSGCNPDIVVIPGFHFPLQVIQLKSLLKNKIKIIAEHHADRPAKGIKKLLQKMADRSIDAYHFTSFGNSKEWIDSGIIRDSSKCREMPAGTTGFKMFDKENSKHKLGMGEGPNFICVGRLNANKDPLTILAAFEKYIEQRPAAKLYMIYQERDLINEITDRLGRNKNLENAVILQGYVSHDELPVWLSAADFYISASHSEGGSIALLEAMACGCIPVITAIPAALSVIERGKYGIYFTPGNMNELYEKLCDTRNLSQNELSESVGKHFEKEFSFEAIAEKFYRSCEQLIAK